MVLDRRTLRSQPLALMATEGLLVFLAVLGAAALRFQGLDESVLLEGGLLLRALLFATITIVCLYYWDFYDPYLALAPRQLAVRLLQALGSAAVLLAVVTYALPPFAIGRGILILADLLILGFLLSWRLALLAIRRADDFQERVLVVGTGTVARRVVQEVLARPSLGFKVHGFIDDDLALQGKSIVNPRVVGTTADLPRLVKDGAITRVVVALTERRGRLPIESLLDLKLTGTRVDDAASFYERVTGKILVEDLRPSWLVFSDGFGPSKSTRLMKRLADLLLATVGLILAGPLMAVIAALIRLESPGPALFRQVRVGEGERLFTLYKFRSMRADAEEATGPVWATANDPRVTRVGYWLRKLRLDELPQLWNVLRGDMSFVGPRPERPHFVEQLKAQVPYYSQRHAVKPGVTGWAQVRYPYGNTVADAVEKLQYDLYYIKNLSLGLDFMVVLQTVKVVLLGRGAV
ncbi:MAG TPA: TIGR03013 family XrtA/PEP-CTERM system glycosyltransferase [Sandaracinaceae bacterium]